MAVSVRMEPLLERELELAAKRQGVTKSQFIIAAVERALGRKDPAQLYHQVMEEAAQYRVSDGGLEGNAPPSTGERLRSKLRAQHEAHSRDWLAYQEARQKGVAWVPDDEGSAP
jgi:RHH-type rel operon transcriptional repressor/antitoxin RelB